MKKNNKGFVVSAVLYPLLVLFLALIMGLLSMSDTRKRILDKMKLEISDSIFDEATCSCDTILNKLNYLIKNGVSGGGGGGSYQQNILGLSVELYEDPSKLPNIGNGIGDIAVITDVEIDSYYVSTDAPSDPKHGTVWIVQDKTSNYHIKSDYSKIGISYAMQYICNDEQTECEWELKKAYVYDEAKWILLYYVSLKDKIVDLESTDINAEIVKTYEYTGEYQTFTARFSGYYRIELWGARGGRRSGSSAFGNGAYTSGEIYLDAGETLYVYVGGVGTASSGGAGGWNGGGKAGTDGKWNSYYTGYGSGGGGATDVRLVNTSETNIWNEFESLKSRIMVASGGGGAGHYYYYRSSDNNSYSYGKGGAGGGVSAVNGSASQTYGSGFGYAGNATSATGGNGGGGGYYGGGATTYGTDTSGSGTSYISGFTGCNSIEEDSTSTNLKHTGSAYHYSGYYFRNGKMVDGGGYDWNEASRNTQMMMPSWDGTSTMTGNSNNGYAKITLVTVEIVEDDTIKKQHEDNENRWVYNYSGTYQTFTAPINGYYQIELWGARGGRRSSSSAFGNGSYTSGEIYLNANQTLYVYVGGVGTASSGGAGGWNGGGKAGTDGTWSSYYTGYGSGGGGATDVRLVNTSASNAWNEYDSLKSRIMVAAGGGGAGHYYYYRSSDNNSYGYGVGGPGGGISAVNGSATQTFGGGFGYGAAATTATGGNGGGGGYYGGTASTHGHNTSGSGTSYISGFTGCNSLDEASTATNLIHTGSAYHYSGFYFKSPVIVDGGGYEWNEAERKTNSNMPNQAGNGMMTGNSNNGYARITLINRETKTKEDLANEKKATENKWIYNYSGTYQTFSVPVNGYYQVELWGAGGGLRTSSSKRGDGSYTTGEIYLNAGEKLYVYVGQQGLSGSKVNGGWNGGGASGTDGTWSTYYTGYGASGGGATDIRTKATTSLIAWNEFESLKSRIMVAGGGGGIGYYYYYRSSDNYTNGYGTGAPGGGVWAVNGSATQTLGGGFGYGAAATTTTGGNGGGGGYYGGTNSSHGHSTSGSGTSYISGFTGCNSLKEESKENELIHTGSAYHYSGHYFINSAMVDGGGYSWNEAARTTKSDMPTKSGSSTMSGNSGHGYAKITLISRETKTATKLEEEKIENENKWIYNYSGTYQKFDVTKTGYYKIELWGAGGGLRTSSSKRGKGAYTSGEIYLTKGNKLYVYVGQQGIGGSKANGGWNGGGAAGTDGTWSSYYTGYGASGGGATDIRTTETSILSAWNEAESLKSRIMVAAGGGGIGYYYYYRSSDNYSNGYATGAEGGGLIGPSSTATQISGAGFGYGAAATTSTGGNGGGGGYYGGNASAHGHSKSDGGSSYISGHAGCIGVNSNGNPLAETYAALADSISYTGYKFVNTQMIDGTGYPWTTVKDSIASQMPNYKTTSTMAGNEGHGYARITYLGA